MKTTNLFIPKIVSLLFCTLLFIGCQTISEFDQTAYQNAINVKVDSIALMAKATESYSTHKEDVEKLNIELDKAFEYDKNRQLNKITVQLWEKLRNPDSELLGGF